jgi:hypothetical protein
MAAPAGGITLTLAADPPYGLLRSGVTVANDSDTVTDLLADRFTLNSATDLGTSGEQPPQLRWVIGYYVVPEHCGGGTLLDPCGSTGGEDPTNPTAIGPVQPFVATAAIDCSTFGSNGPQMAEAARRKLRAVRSFQLEREFWTGTAAQAGGFTDNQWLTKTGAGGITRYIENNSAVGTTTALAELEQAIADGSTWEVGMIHAMPRTVTYWIENGLVTQARPGVFVTGLGTLVVAGRGYPGTGPGGASSFQGVDSGLATTSGQYAYAYATSMVYVGTGRPMDTEEGDDSGMSSLDPTNNMRTHRAWQAVFAAWDGCVHASVLIDHNATRTAIGS